MRGASSPPEGARRARPVPILLAGDSWVDLSNLAVQEGGERAEDTTPTTPQRQRRIRYPKQSEVLSLCSIPDDLSADEIIRRAPNRYSCVHFQTEEVATGIPVDCLSDERQPSATYATAEESIIVSPPTAVNSVSSGYVFAQSPPRQRQRQERHVYFRENSEYLSSSHPDAPRGRSPAHANLDRRTNNNDQQSAILPEINIEVNPGFFLPLRRSGETIHAIESGNAQHINCISCGALLSCPPDCEMVICPDCRFLSPGSPSCDTTRFLPFLPESCGDGDSDQSNHDRSGLAGVSDNGLHRDSTGAVSGVGVYANSSGNLHHDCRTSAIPQRARQRRGIGLGLKIG